MKRIQKSAIVEAIPAGLPMVVAFVSVALMILLELRLLSSILVITVCVPLVVLGYKITRRVIVPSRNKKQVITDFAAIVGVCMWVVVNCIFTSQNVFTARDPAIYNGTAAWLILHNDARMDRSTALPNDAQIKAVTHDMQSPPQVQDATAPQGNNLLPVLLGLSGRVLGEAKMFRVMPFIGGLALLAFYGFARQVLRPKWAAFATLILGCSMPFVYFSRDAFTEPLTLAFLFSGLSMLWYAHKKGDLIAWAVAAICFGATTLTRIDAWLPLSGLALFLSAYLFLSNQENRSQRIREVSVVSLIVAAIGFIGWFDASSLSYLYYAQHRKYFLPEIVFVTVPILLTGLLVGFFPELRDRLQVFVRGLLTKRNMHWLIVATVAFCGVLLARPLLIGNLQNNGLHKTYLYGLQTTEWLSWYLGYALLIAGFAGAVRMFQLILNKKDLKYLALLLVFAVPTLFYLLLPSITPDQVWAMRRFLPTTIPCLILFAGFFLQWFVGKFSLYRKYTTASVAALLFIVLLPIFTVTRVNATARLQTQMRSIKQLCDSLPENSGVVWLGQAAEEAVMPTRSYCQTPSIGYSNLKITNPTEPSHEKELLALTAEQLRSEGRTPLVGLYATQSDILTDSDFAKLSQAGEMNWLDLEASYSAAPRKTVQYYNILMIGVIDQDGTIKPLSELSR